MGNTWTGSVFHLQHLSTSLSPRLAGLKLPRVLLPLKESALKQSPRRSRCYPWSDQLLIGNLGREAPPTVFAWNRQNDNWKITRLDWFHHLLKAKGKLYRFFICLLQWKREKTKTKCTLVYLFIYSSIHLFTPQSQSAAVNSATDTTSIEIHLKAPPQVGLLSTRARSNIERLCLLIRTIGKRLHRCLLMLAIARSSVCAVSVGLQLSVCY